MRTLFRVVADAPLLGQIVAGALKLLFNRLPPPRFTGQPPFEIRDQFGQCSFLVGFVSETVFGNSTGKQCVEIADLGIARCQSVPQLFLLPLQFFSQRDVLGLKFIETTDVGAI